MVGIEGGYANSYFVALQTTLCPPRIFFPDYLIQIENGPVCDLLNLVIFQVFAHHHLQNLEKLVVGDVSVPVHVVDVEGEPQLPVIVRFTLNTKT